jgi:ADP-heptose:LPS heptosyltransferase
LGDLLLSIPLLKKTRELFPEEKIGLVCRKGFGDFLIRNGAVDFVFEIKKGDEESYAQALLEISKFSVRNLISPHQSFRTGLFCKKIKAESKVSFSNWWTFLFFNKHIKRDLRLPDALRQMSLLSVFDEKLKGELEAYARYEKPFESNEFGKLPSPPSWGDMSLRSELMKDAETFERLKSTYGLEYKGKTVLIFPGSVWATKRWTCQGFIDTGRKLVNEGYEVIIMGGPGEELLAEKVASEIPRAKCLAGKTKVFESAQLIMHANLVIGNDSASAHLAAVCDTPLVAVFGPTVLNLGYRPWGQTSYVVEVKEMQCRPCGKHGHNECPLKTHACMKEISYQDVIKAAHQALS